MKELKSELIPSPLPIFGPLSWSKKLTSHSPYPDCAPNIRRFILNCDIENAESDYTETLEFLILNGRRSEQTYNAFRTEVERFLMWAWIIKKTSIANLKRSDFDKYIDFCMKPPIGWVGIQRVRHFIDAGGGEYEPNAGWTPFRIKEADYSSRAKYIKRNVAQNTLVRQFSVLNVYFKYLFEKDYVLGNPIPLIKKYSPYLITDSEPPTIKRLRDDHWKLVLDVLNNAANENHLYERHLFITVTLKSLYLRVSEVSNRVNWQPVMGHFFRDNGNYLWLRVFGKGNKMRRVSVPDAYLPYLERYRIYRGLSPMPIENEESPLIHKIKGSSGVSTRQATRIIEESFALVVEWLISQGRDHDALEIKAASSHWLRHTGASMDVSTRDLKHLSEDLGHASSATTDKHYIQSDIVARAKSGKNRDI